MQSQASDAPRSALAQRLDELARDLWRDDLERFPRWRAAPYLVGRLVVAATQSFLESRRSLNAAALSFISLLSLVPLLALGFALAKGFGAYEVLLEGSIKPYLDDLSTGEAGGGQLRQAIDQVLEFVHRTNFSTLGALGLVLLVATVVKLLSSVEETFNHVWGVRRSRDLVRKLTDYLTIVVIAPILLLIATTVTAGAQNNAVVDWLSARLPIDAVLGPLLRIAPLVTVWIGMAFVLHTLPNTATRWSSSLLGGVVGGTAWQLAQVLHVEFQIGVARYNAIYAGFAALPIFLVWLQLSWQIVLFAAELAHAHQAGLHLRPRQAGGSSQAWLEELGLWVALAIAERFERGEKPIGVQALALRAGCSEAQVEHCLRALSAAGLVVEVRQERAAGQVLARDPRSIRAADVLEALRAFGAAELEAPPQHRDSRSSAVLRGFEQETRASARNASLHDLVQSAAR